MNPWFMAPCCVRGHTGAMNAARDNTSAGATPPVPARDASWALFLDFDGTLVELAPTPDAVHVPAEMPRQLQALSQALDGALALVSGRAIDVLDRMLAPLRLPAAGLHGMERRDRQGDVFRIEPDQRALDEARRALSRFIVAHPDCLLEDKQASLALHFRRDPDAADAARRAAEDALAQAGDSAFEIQSGHMVYEIKSRAADKGAALHAFLDEDPFAGRTPIFLGDDDTDEHGFRVAAAHGGYGVRVGTRGNAGDGTAARYRLADPAAVQQWLRDWLAHTGNTGA